MIRPVVTRGDDIWWTGGRVPRTEYFFFLEYSPIRTTNFNIVDKTTKYLLFLPSPDRIVYSNITHDSDVFFFFFYPKYSARFWNFNGLLNQSNNCVAGGLSVTIKKIPMYPLILCSDSKIARDICGRVRLYSSRILPKYCTNQSCPFSNVTYYF